MKKNYGLDNQTMGVRGEDEGTLVKRGPAPFGCDMGRAPSFLRMADRWMIVGSESTTSSRKSANTSK